MKVTLTWITPNAEDLIVHMARVSRPQELILASETSSQRLLHYLIAHSHWSPFEMASACFEILTTRDIARQILRHRSFSFQEFSQRYASPEFYEPREARLQDTKNRQNSLQLSTSNTDLHDWWREVQLTYIATSLELYNRAIRAGLAKEVARAVLPEGLTSTRLYMTGTFRSWLHYTSLRTSPDTQKEHREIATSIKTILHQQSPTIFAPQ